MSEETDFNLAHVAPVFQVTDLARARFHYTAKLLFSVAFEWSDSDGEPPRYAIVRHGDCELHLTLSTEAHPTVAYVFVDRVKAYYDAVKAKGANITHDIEDQPWEMREFETADPDDNRLIFGEHLSRIDDQA